MASTATATAKGRAGVTEEAKAEWWLRFNNGAPADDGDVADSGDEAGEEGQEGSSSKAEMVARGGGNAEAGAAGTGDKTRSSPRFAHRAAVDEEIAGGDYVQPGELPRRKRKAKSPCAVPKGPGQVYGENQNLRLQLALKTNELKQEENRRLKSELILKAKEMESLEKQNEELKAENEQLRKNYPQKLITNVVRSVELRSDFPNNCKAAKSRKVMQVCEKYVMHDSRNCPEKRQPPSSPEEENGEDSY
ncbi:hypothetical protein HU200_031256 [Digitaria exilis]|uniref:Uncharacterized protein n=1 Tax=Digitaria exilis TaxID=1010633 RepID=A0A835ERL6_9POAL|nr:hypothetical protein HU200_031256 [Digitaria exilis]